MVVEWIAFEDALKRTEEKRRHLLLGNGFSIAVHKGFSYGSLYGEAVRHDRDLPRLFEGSGTDFEKAIAAAPTREDRERIRAVFIRAISHIHPKRKYLPPEVRAACGNFLEPFAGRHSRKALSGHVFTTNYDLMLYWVLMANRELLNLYDGFDVDGVWDSGRVRKSTLFYLHGALHHYEVQIGRVRPEMDQRKLMWREEASLIDQVRLNLNAYLFPVFVAEGRTEEKTWSINSNPYLKRVRKHLIKTCKDPDAAFFTLGHSLADVDAHIIDVLGFGETEVFLGVFRPFDNGSHAQSVVNRWNKTREDLGKSKLRVSLYDTSACKIWAPKTSSAP